MKKRILNLMLALILMFSLALTVSAQGPPLVVDQADLLTDTQEEALEEKASALREPYQMDIVIVTTDSLGGKTPEAYADDYFDENGYGYGEDYSGILFLLSMEYRDWYISTCGDGIYALTDYGIQEVASAALPYLSDGLYYEAFDAYLDELVTYLDAFQAGHPIDGKADLSGDRYTGINEETVHYREKTSLWRLIFPCAILGLAAAAVTLIVMRSTMNTKKRQSAASAYLLENSFRLHRNQDMFLYSRVTKTRRQESSSGGGSSTHRSSSGRSHGGGGGKF